MSEFIRSLKSDRVIQRRLRNDVELDVHYSDEAGLAWLDGAPGSAFDVKSYYQETYARLYYTEKEKSQLESNFNHFLPLQQRRVAAIVPHLKAEDSLLEVGSGPGYFLTAVQPHVRIARGLEFNQKEAEYARQVRSLDIRTASLAEVRGETYDHVCLFQVLEHQPDPVDFLKELKELCSATGSLIHIEIPTLHNPLVSLYQIPAFRDFWFQKPHLYYFTEKGLERVCKEAGLSIVSLARTQETSLFNHYHWMSNGTPMKHRKFAVDPSFPEECVDTADASKREVFERVGALLERTNAEYQKILLDSGFGELLFCTAAPNGSR
jgi:cyclopropane fatty-acyl-phospholipid synthase-like methyltransferase